MRAMLLTRRHFSRTRGCIMTHCQFINYRSSRTFGRIFMFNAEDLRIYRVKSRLSKNGTLISHLCMRAHAHAILLTRLMKHRASEPCATALLITDYPKKSYLKNKNNDHL